MKAFWPRLQPCWRSLDPFLPPFLLLSSRDSGINALDTKKRTHSPHLDFVSGVLPIVGLRQSKDFLPSSSLESSPPTPRRTSLESFQSLVFVRELPVPPLREWSPTPRRTSLESFPSLVFVREFPVPPFREWSPTPRRTSLESFPSLGGDSFLGVQGIYPESRKIEGGMEEGRDRGISNKFEV
ncbi:Hypothetical protein FKW44_010762 [Caligus rogercresseyi]|uniref:Uncharacterized protein n=1 Tax=Caligus rogercresseyi TaxID=217165 RepID=A0A7T8HH22_CALRO|nr:Hypothetical protein FKW44_010762 [Caligus rogercresseyi]